MKVRIFTSLPEVYPGILGAGVIGRACVDKKWDLQVVNLYDYGLGKRKNIDDYSYGGGAGMIIAAPVIGDALEDVLNDPYGQEIIYLSPRGQVFDSVMAGDFSRKEELNLICGRFEGIDQRVIDEYQVKEVSVGKFVLATGDVAAMVLLEASLRLIDGVLGGGNESLKEESFSGELQDQGEYDQFTRPKVWKNRQVPEVLLSGDHSKVRDFRLTQPKLSLA